MTITTPWQRWFAWRPVRDMDGRWHWLCYVERRDVRVKLFMLFGVNYLSEFTQYRTYWRNFT